MNIISRTCNPSDDLLLINPLLPASAPGSLLLCRSSDSTPVPLCPSVPIPYLDPQTTKRKPQFLLICWVSPKYHHGITEYQMHKGPKKYLF
jgi:hypothetical protein